MLTRNCCLVSLDPDYETEAGGLHHVHQAQEGESQEEPQGPSKLTDQGLHGVQPHLDGIKMIVMMVMMMMMVVGIMMITMLSILLLMSMLVPW